MGLTKSIGCCRNRCLGKRDVQQYSLLQRRPYLAGTGAGAASEAAVRVSQPGRGGGAARWAADQLVTLLRDAGGLARLAHVQMRLMGQRFEQLLVRRREGGADLVHHLAELPTAHRQTHHVAQQLVDQRVRHPAAALQITDGSDEARAEQAGAADFVRQRRDDDAPGARASGPR